MRRSGRFWSLAILCGIGALGIHQWKLSRDFREIKQEIATTTALQQVRYVKKKISLESDLKYFQIVVERFEDGKLQRGSGPSQESCSGPFEFGPEMMVHAAAWESPPNSGHAHVLLDIPEASFSVSFPIEIPEWSATMGWFFGFLEGDLTLKGSEPTELLAFVRTMGGRPEVHRSVYSGAEGGKRSAFVVKAALVSDPVAARQ